jgi:anaerobic ribonucleoside-triphosphate reductase activating protein
LLIWSAKNKYPDIKIFIWTGYTYDYLEKIEDYIFILSNIDYLIEGPFILTERDITLKWRGSRNQRIINMKTREEVK